MDPEAMWCLPMGLRPLSKPLQLASQKPTFLYPTAQGPQPPLALASVVLKVCPPPPCGLPVTWKLVRNISSGAHPVPLNRKLWGWVRSPVFEGALEVILGLTNV